MRRNASFPAPVKPLWAALAVVLGLAAPVARSDDKDVIEYREHIMKSMNEQSAILGQIASGALPSDNLAAHLEATALLAATALKAFEPRAPGGEAKAEVWANWMDFAGKMKEFAEKTDAAAKLAKTQGPDAALPAMLEAMTCRNCHKSYRDEKKK